MSEIIEYYTVNINNFSFPSPSLTIKPNSIVRWVIGQNSSDYQSVDYLNRFFILSIDDLEIESNKLYEGDVFQHYFQNRGAYLITCQNYPWLKQKVIVGDEIPQIFKETQEIQRKQIEEKPTLLEDIEKDKQKYDKNDKNDGYKNYLKELLIDFGKENGKMLVGEDSDMSDWNFESLNQSLRGKTSQDNQDFDFSIDDEEDQPEENNQLKFAAFQNLSRLISYDGLNKNTHSFENLSKALSNDSGSKIHVNDLTDEQKEINLFPENALKNMSVTLSETSMQQSFNNSTSNENNHFFELIKGLNIKEEPRSVDSSVEYQKKNPKEALKNFAEKNFEVSLHEQLLQAKELTTDEINILNLLEFKFLAKKKD